MYVPDPLKAVREMMRLVLPASADPGGRVVAAVWGQRKNCGWAEIFPIVDARVKSEVCPMFFSLGTGTTLADVFRDAGLVDVVSERIETRLEWASDDEACGAAFEGGPVALAYGRFDERTKYRVQREYLDSIAQWRVRSSTVGVASAAGAASATAAAGATSHDGPNGHANGAGGHSATRGYLVPGEFVIVAGRRPV
jgi:hypothetical protein